MDEPLKARLIGAAVLVVVAVALIPELLSGRKAAVPVDAGAGAPGTRTFTIELGQQPGQVSRAVTPAPSAAAPASAPTAPPDVGAAEPAPAPVAAATPSAAVAAAAPDRASVAEPRSTDAPAASPATEPAAPSASAAAAPGRGSWAVQVGAFGSADTARRLVTELTGAGYRAYLSPVARGGKTLHRVRVGAEPEKSSAEQLAQRLKARGLPATVVQND